MIPAASGTIVRWSFGTLAAHTPDAGTVTITARAGAPTEGTGTPEQTFTNHATLSGTDAAGRPFSEPTSAGVVVRALDITLGKSVDHTFLSELPGTVTYTLPPEAGGNNLLSNVRVIDPYPAGLGAPPAATAGGTVRRLRPGRCRAGRRRSR